VFCIANKGGLGLLYPPVTLDVHERAHKIASARHGAFWLKPVSIFGLLPGYDVYQAFTYVDLTTHSSPRSALMLADPCVPLRFPRQYCYWESLSAGFYYGWLPPRFATQEYCWWNSGLPESCLSGAISYATSRRTL